MKLKIYAIRDRQTDQYGNPMFLIQHGQAVRSFSDEVNRKEDTNGLYRHPEDFDLYYLGEYDSSEGEFETRKPEMIAVGKKRKG